MNELMTGRGQAFSGGGEFQRIDNRYVAVRTTRPISHKFVPDVSGNFHTGQMNGGAHFPQEFLRSHPSLMDFYRDENVGSVGKGVFLQAGGAITISDSRKPDINPFAVQPESLLKNRHNMTIEVDYQILANVSTFMSLVTRRSCERAARS